MRKILSESHFAQKALSKEKPLNSLLSPLVFSIFQMAAKRRINVERTMKKSRGVDSSFGFPFFKCDLRIFGRYVLLRKFSRLRPSLLSLKSSVLLGENILGLKHTNRKKCSCIPLQISVSPGDSEEPKASQNYKI